MLCRSGRWLAGLVLAALGLAALHAGAAPFAYITNQGSHDVSVVDLATQTVIATVPVGRSPAGVVASSHRPRLRVQPRQQDDLGDRHALATRGGDAAGRPGLGRH
jgi:YVTN family beta-propeller protein